MPLLAQVFPPGLFRGNLEDRARNRFLDPGLERPAKRLGVDHAPGDHGVGRRVLARIAFDVIEEHIGADEDIGPVRKKIIEAFAQQDQRPDVPIGFAQGLSI